MRRSFLVLFLTAAASVAAAQSDTTAPTTGTVTTASAGDTPLDMVTAVRRDWAAAGLWDDGNAEVATYDGERVIYGESRPHTLRLITVKEDLNRTFMTKADWPYGEKPILTTLKQNQVATIPTPNYDYHYMVTLFVDRARPTDSVKMTVTSQEWCGTTAKEFALHQEPARMRYMSYWDGEGSGEAVLRDHGPRALFEEELPLLVRALDLREGLRVSMLLEPNQTTTRAEVPKPSPATLRVESATEDLHVPAGAWLAEELWQVSLRCDDGRAWTWWVAHADPQTLVRFECNDGRRYDLRETTRRQYWKIGG